MKEFTLGEAAAFFATLPLAMEHETRHSLEIAARIVEHEAKAEIGHYQDAAGPFPAWDPLAESTKEDRVRKGFPEDEPLLRTSELRDSIEHKVEANALGGEAVVGSDSDIALFQEVGTTHIPPRSFLGGAAVRKEKDVVKAIGEGAVVALAGGAFRRTLRGPTE